LATEITGRFRESSTHFTHDQVEVVVIAWLPEYIIYGRPKVLDLWFGSALDMAKTRDKHYHNPPEYLVIEPEDTSERTINLQQTNTNGLRLQENARLAEALSIVEGWGESGKEYSPAETYQQRLRELRRQFRYRLDTNFAKIDRIQHEGLESFKSYVLARNLYGYTIQEWTRQNLLQEPTILEMLLDLE